MSSTTADEAGSAATRLRQYEEQINLMKLSYNGSSNENVYNHMFEYAGYFNKKNFINTSLMKLSDDSILGRIAVSTATSTMQKNSDFTVSPLVRSLYIGYHAETDTWTRIPPNKSLGYDEDKHIKLATARSEILSSFDDLQFWPTLGESNYKMNDVVFWSENHMLMWLSSSHLYEQHKKLFPNNTMSNDFLGPKGKFKTRKAFLDDVNSHLLGRSTTQLLLTYLRGHCHPDFNGLYEVNAPAYVHYTMGALLNLYDFSINAEIRRLAEQILDRMIHLLMLATDPSTGVFSITASGRMYPKNTKQIDRFGISPFIRAMNKGISPDKPSDLRINGDGPAGVPADDYRGYDCRHISNFITTTRWRPKPDAFEALHGTGLPQPIVASHEHDGALDAIYGIDLWPRKGRLVNKNHLHYAPIYWSAGYLFQKDFFPVTKAYLDDFGTNLKTPLLGVDLAINGDLQMAQASDALDNDAFKNGQKYTGFKYNVWKDPSAGVVLSSFYDYNVGNFAFQQKAWFANIRGAPIHSQSLSENCFIKTAKEWLDRFKATEHLAVFQNASTPHVQQQESIMLITYVRDDETGKVRLFWPAHCFENPREDRDSRENLDKTLPNQIREIRRDDEVEPRNWLVGKRDNVYVGAYMSGWQGGLSEDDDDNNVIDGRLMKPQPRKDKKNDHIFFHYAQSPWSNPKRRISRYEIISIVMVIGTSVNFNSIEDFVNNRLKKIKIEHVEGSDQITVIDETVGFNNNPIRYPNERTCA